MGGEQSTVSDVKNIIKNIHTMTNQFKNLPVTHRKNKYEVRTYFYPDRKFNPKANNNVVKDQINEYVRYHILRNGCNLNNLSQYSYMVYTACLESKKKVTGKVKTKKFVKKIESLPISNHDLKTDIITSMVYYTK